MSEKVLIPCKKDKCIRNDEYLIPDQNRLDLMGYFVPGQLFYCFSCTHFKRQDYFEARKED